MKITGHYLSTFALTTPLLPPWLKGLTIAVLGSAFIYLAHFAITHPLLHSILLIAWLFTLLAQPARVWFWHGFFIGLLWFWWIGVSFVHYGHVWLAPLVPLGVGLIYGLMFYLTAKTAVWLALKAKHLLHINAQTDEAIKLTLKVLALWSLGAMTPFGFDWYRPQIVGVHSFFGVESWRFILLGIAIALTLATKRTLLLLIGVLSIDPSTFKPNDTCQKPCTIAIVTTYTTAHDKWDQTKHPAQHKALLQKIDDAIEAGKKVVILPESVFAVFLNYDQKLLDALKQRSRRITIVTGGLFWDEGAKQARNATYVFYPNGNIEVAHKVVLVPFGEANPLPEFLSDIVNRIFYDGAIDYTPASEPSDFIIGNERFRNAICYEATSKRLYDPPPKKMIILSNHAWFYPSIEPTLQRLLLLSLHRLYATEFYHAGNMAPSYIIKEGCLFTM